MIQASRERLDLVVAANVRRLLAARGMTQRALASLLGIPEARLSAILNRPEITLRRVAELAAALEVPCAALVTPPPAEKKSCRPS